MKATCLMILLLALIAPGCENQADSPSAQGGNVYQDLLPRRNLEDVGEFSGSATAMSPDIIPWGNTPLVDPTTFLSRNFDQDVGKNVAPGLPNYLYVRALNLDEQKSSGRVSLFWAEPSLVLPPRLWSGNQIYTNSGRRYVDVSALPGQVAVTAEPFVLVPTPLSSDNGFSLVTQITTNKYPNPIPVIEGVSDYLSWITSARGFSMRTVFLTDGSVPQRVFQYRFMNVDHETQPYAFVVTAHGFPPGSKISFGDLNPGGSPPIQIAPVSVDQDPFSVEAGSQLPGDYQSALYITVTSPAQAISKGSLEISMYFAPNGEDRSLVGQATVYFQ